jgi:hypothetical protein
MATSTTRGTLLVFMATIVLSTAAARADVVSLTINPNTVFGTDSATGTVQLDFEPFPRVRTVTLMSSNPQVASVPASVQVGLGHQSANFPVGTSAVATSTNVTITATHSGVSRQAVITVRPPELVSVTFNPNPVVGGITSVATITINRPAPANWLCSIQGPFPPIYFMTGSIVSFTPGATTTTKQVNTQAVSSPVNALITVRPPSGQAPSISSILSVVPIRVESLTLHPTAVSAGGASLGCVTLNAPAPAGGATVALESSDPNVATVPPTVLINAGDTDNCFLVQSQAGVECGSSVISATYGGLTVQGTLGVGSAIQLTNNAANDQWSIRHSTTCRGKVLWTDGDDVLLNNGATNSVIQARGTMEAVEPTVLGLGSGAAAGQTVAAWRRGTDYAWIWRSDGGAPVLVTATNPIDPTQPMNPEALAIADGSVFVTLQAFANANSVKHVFRVNPATGLATNLTGNAPVPGAIRLTTASGKAAWVFDDNSGAPKLHFYNGTTVQTVDSGAISATSLRLAAGRLVYQKLYNGVQHVFLYDSNVPSPTPVRISPDVAATLGHFAPVTDGRHIAWLTGNANGTDTHVALSGGLALSGPAEIAAFGEQTLQMQRGQLLWTDHNGDLRYAHDGAIETACALPAASVNVPWLADGMMAWYGPGADGGTDNEVFRLAGSTPDDADQPLPPLKVVATAESRSVALNWDPILGATSYNVYVAAEPGITKGNYSSLDSGRRIVGITAASEVVDGLTNGQPYYFVVTAVEGGDEGGESAEVSAVPQNPWIAVGGFAGVGFYAVAAHPTDGAVAYAAGNNTVYKTTDGGFTWTPLGGAIAGRDVRALAVDGETVFALDIDGDDVLRSSNGGLNWAVVANGGDFGEINCSIAIDPSNSQVIYAGDLRLTPGSATLVIRSIDGGDTWEHIPTSDIGELHAYALAIDPTGVVYLGGSGVPVARSDTDGASWTDISSDFYQVYSLAIDPHALTTLYAGTRDQGVYKTTNSGGSWTQINNGLPLQQYQAVPAIVIDPQQSQHVLIGTAIGAYESTNGGGDWTEHALGMGQRWVYGMARTTAGRTIAATANGLYLLDAACPGDLDGDQSIGLQDLAYLLGNFGTPSGAVYADGDLDGDGDVDLQDLANLLAAFGTTCQ